MKKKIPPANRERYELLKRLLEDRRSDIQEKLRSLREALPVETADVRDAEEQSVDDFVQEIDFALMQMKSETLLRIDEALGRLENDTYGRCIECGGDIAAGRLKALPFAELCRACQEAHENEARDAREAEQAVRTARILDAGARSHPV
jgi:DnaK suppressor protein